jgi:hypothetical protein
MLYDMWLTNGNSTEPIYPIDCSAFASGIPICAEYSFFALTAWNVKFSILTTMQQK